MNYPDDNGPYLTLKQIAQALDVRYLRAYSLVVTRGELPYVFIDRPVWEGRYFVRVSDFDAYVSTHRLRRPVKKGKSLSERVPARLRGRVKAARAAAAFHAKNGYYPPPDRLTGNILPEEMVGREKIRVERASLSPRSALTAPIYSVRDVAALTGLTEQRVYQLLNEGPRPDGRYIARATREDIAGCGIDVTLITKPIHWVMGDEVARYRSVQKVRPAPYPTPRKKRRRRKSAVG